jgi:hypothetical protein
MVHAKSHTLALVKLVYCECEFTQRMGLMQYDIQLHKCHHNERDCLTNNRTNTLANASYIPGPVRGACL